MAEQVYPFRIDGATYTVTVSNAIALQSSNYFNVKTGYGAAGDGSTDDAAAIQNAINAAEAVGGAVYFPYGTYLIGTELTTDAGPIAFFGDGWGSILKADDMSGDILNSTADELLVHSLCFDGNISGQASVSNADICISVLDGSDVRILGCKFLNPEADGVYVANSSTQPSRVTIDGCHFVGTHENRNGISVVGGDQIIITNNHLYQMGRVGTPGAIDIEPNASESVGDVLIQGNTIVGAASGTTPYAQGINISTSAAGSSIDRLRVEGNVLSGWFEDGIRVGGDNCADVSICENTIDMDSDVANSAAIGVVNDSGGEIRGNTIRTDNGTVANRPEYGIYINASTGTWDVSENTIIGVQTYGINCNGQNPNYHEVHIDSNVFNGCGASAVATEGGIRAAILNGSITNNKFRGTIPAAIRFPNVAGTGNNKIGGNIFGSSVTTRYSGTPRTDDTFVPGVEVNTAAADDTTPTVWDTGILQIPANTGAAAITQLDDAVKGQVVTILITSATNPSSITDGGNFALVGNWAPAAVNESITLFTADGTNWVERSRAAP